MTTLQTLHHRDADGHFVSGGFTLGRWIGVQPGWNTLTIETGVIRTKILTSFMNQVRHEWNFGYDFTDGLRRAADHSKLELLEQGNGRWALADLSGRFQGIDAVMTADDDGGTRKFFEIYYRNPWNEGHLFRGEWKDLIDGRLRLLTEFGVRTFNSDGVLWTRTLAPSDVSGHMLASQALRFELHSADDEIILNWSVGVLFDNFLEMEAHRNASLDLN